MTTNGEYPKETLRNGHSKQLMESGEISYRQISIFINIVLVILLGSIVFNADNIWADEGFTLQIIKSRYVDIIKINEVDVHPTLYYFLLKMFVTLGRFWENQFVNFSRLFSFVPFFLLVVFCYTARARELLGKYVICIPLLLCTLPQMIFSLCEVRMYSWSAMFVFLAVVAGCKIVSGSDRKILWMALVFFTLCAMYTHYYSVIASGILWLGVLLLKQEKKYKYWLLGVGSVLVLYMPQMIMIVRQVGG